MGTLTVSGAVAGLTSGQVVIGPVTTTGNNIIGEVVITTLSTGDTTFAVPAGSVKVAIFLGTSATTTVTLRTNLNSGDAGVPIGPVTGTPWTALDIPTGVTSYILHSSGSLPGVQLNFV